MQNVNRLIQWSVLTLRCLLFCLYVVFQQDSKTPASVILELIKRIKLWTDVLWNKSYNHKKYDSVLIFTYSKYSEICMWQLCSALIGHYIFRTLFWGSWSKILLYICKLELLMLWYESNIQRLRCITPLDFLKPEGSKVLTFCT